jgi:hypothetical protein
MKEEQCPNGCEEKKESASSHTWTKDSNTYFKSYVTYCPRCLYIYSTDARL